MLASQTPTKVPLPFASSGTKNAIPTASQIGITPGAASLTDGFPPLTMTPLAAGGVAPSGADFNGILNLLSQSIRWYQAGGQVNYDATFASAIGGYPLGACLAATSIAGSFWINNIDGNTSNPDTGGAGWKLFSTGVTQMAIFTSSGTWTCPADVTRVKARLVGGGGSGASSTSGSNPGGGGGGGGYVETIVIVTPGTNYTVNVGAGGSNNSAGTASSFAGQTANGGSAGVPGTNSAPGAGGAGGYGYITGTGIIYQGGAGSFGIYYSSSCIEGGNGGGSIYVSPVRAIGVPGTPLTASPGLFPGGGSTGCTGTGYANGAAGLVILEY